MSYRDWGRGEGPRERQPIARWDDPGEPLPADPYTSGAERYRTASRRRAVERGQQEPSDTYLPRWALESGVERADGGGGRHAAPDDDEDEFDRPRSGGGWGSTETTSNWRREASLREVPAIGASPASEHTSEWTFDRPQEQGYAGRRRAELPEEQPVSGAMPESRPRRSPSRRPQVIWSGGDETTTSAEPDDRWDTGRPTRRSRRATADSWTQPVADTWERGARSADPEPLPPAVDPWDASGVHAWQRSTGTSPWDQTDGASRWVQTDGSGRWDQADSTGQFDRFTDTGQWDRTEPPRSARTSAAEGWAWAEEPEPPDGFWSGTRLAGDDPRWMDPPPSAPRSPVVAYTAPRPRTVPRRRSEPASGARGTGGDTLRRRMESVAGVSWNRRLEDDLLDPDPGGPFRPLFYTAACYLLPALVVFVWLLTLDGQAPAGCVTDISGGGCDSPRSHAFGSLVAGAPRFGLALASSLVVAVLLRRVGTTWRSTTVALAAAVVGGGLSTVVISAVTGQPIG